MSITVNRAFISLLCCLTLFRVVFAEQPTPASSDPVDSDPSASDPENETEDPHTKLQSLIGELVDIRLNRQRAHIKTLEEEERKNGIRWKPFTLPNQ